MISILNLLALLTEHVAALDAKLESRGDPERNVSEKGSIDSDKEPLTKWSEGMDRSGSLAPSFVKP